MKKYKFRRSNQNTDQQKRKEWENILTKSYTGKI